MRSRESPVLADQDIKIVPALRRAATSVRTSDRAITRADGPEPNDEIVEPLLKEIIRLKTRFERALDQTHNPFRMKSVCKCVEQHLAYDAQRHQ